MNSRVKRRATDISDWCATKQLQLNADKIDLLWFRPASQLRQLSPDSLSITINQNVIKPSSVDRHMGTMFDAEELSMRRIYHRRASYTCVVCAQFISVVTLPRDWFQLLCCRSLTTVMLFLLVIPASTLASLQRVLHAAARIILDLKPHGHVR